MPGVQGKRVATVFVHWLRRLMEARMGTLGRREFQVLRLMEDFHQRQVEAAPLQPPTPQAEVR
jgi:hypothetical protein